MPSDILQRLQELQAQIDDLRSRRINLNTDLTGLFEVVSSVPTGKPNDLFDQIKIYTSGTNYRLYWYDQVNHAWHYATGT